MGYLIRLDNLIDLQRPSQAMSTRTLAPSGSGSVSTKSEAAAPTIEEQEIEAFKETDVHLKSYP